MGASCWYTIRCLLDSGSQAETITQAAASALGIPIAQNNLRVKGIGGSLNTTGKIDTIIASRFGNFRLPISLIIIPQVLDEQPSIEIRAGDLDTPKNIKLADPTFYHKRSVDVILGSRVFFQILGPRRVQCANGPNLQESALGWLVGGLVDLKVSQTATIAAASICDTQKEVINYDVEDKLEDLFSKFWALEEVTLAEARSPLNSDNRCEDYFVNSTTVRDDGKFVVRLPFKEEPVLLGNSLDQAKRRLFSLERRLALNAGIYNQYRAFLAEYIALDHMERVEPNNVGKVHYFIPHSCVIKPDSTSTKLRVVFDASAKTTNGRSLNDTLLSGPPTQSEQFDLLLDFR